MQYEKNAILPLVGSPAYAYEAQMVRVLGPELAY